MGERERETVKGENGQRLRVEIRLDGEIQMSREGLNRRRGSAGGSVTPHLVSDPGNWNRTGRHRNGAVTRRVTRVPPSASSLGLQQSSPSIVIAIKTGSPRAPMRVTRRRGIAHTWDFLHFSSRSFLQFFFLLLQHRAKYEREEDSCYHIGIYPTMLLLSSNLFVQLDVLKILGTVFSYSQKFARKQEERGRKERSWNKPIARLFPD